MNNNLHIGSSLDDFLEEEGILEEINLIAIKRVIAWQIKHAMEEKKLTKSDMAKQGASQFGKNAHRLEAWGYTNKACLRRQAI